MEWQPSDVIALVAVIMSPIGGLLVAWYTAHRQDRAADRQDLKDRRSDVEDALAEVERVRSLMSETVGVAMIADPGEAMPDARPVGELPPAAQQAVAKVAHARVRHPGDELSASLATLLDQMQTLSWWASMAAQEPDIETAERVAHSLGVREQNVRVKLDEATRQLREYHNEAAVAPRRHSGFS